MYVLDAIALRKVSLSTLEVSTVAGIRFTAMDVPTQPVLLPAPSTIWSDGIFIYVGGTGVIQRFDARTGELKTLAGTTFSGGFQDGIGEAARLGAPQGIWSDGQYVYFLDDSLRRLNLATREVTTWVGRALRLS